jgi:[acyl-carrier-protein] S-malonyltransferase
MAAILGLDAETVAAGCAEAAKGAVCSPANINSPAQVVIAGNVDAVDRACEILKERGARRAIKLNVSAPFHCSLMMPAQERLAADLVALQYDDFAFPIIHNVDAEVNVESSLVIDKLTRQVSSTVKWLQSMERMAVEGVDLFVEIGPGKVLTGLVRQMNRDAAFANIENTEGLRNTLETL